MYFLRCCVLSVWLGLVHCALCAVHSLWRKRVVIVMVRIYLFIYTHELVPLRVTEAQHHIECVNSIYGDEQYNKNIWKKNLIIIIWRKRKRTRPAFSCFLQSYYIMWFADVFACGEVRCGHKVPTSVRQTYYSWLEMNDCKY